MKRLNNKFLPKLAISLALVSTMSMPSFAGDIVTFNDLRDAIDGATTGETTLNIINDLTNTEISNKLGTLNNASTSVIIEAGTNLINAVNTVGSITSKGVTVNSGSTLTVNGGNFINFDNTDSGGVIFSSGNGTVLNINNSIFGAIGTSNNATNGGGAILNESKAHATISNSQFIGNNGGTFGGAISNYNATLTIKEGSKFLSNSASNGGAICNDNGGGVLIVENSIFGEAGKGNTATQKGGAIYNGNYATATITNSTFTSNTATNAGGAVYNSDGATATITNSTFTSNTATNGGGAIENFGTMNFENDTIFVGNSATNYYGGAIDNNSGATMTFNGSTTFIDNIANTKGGAIYNAGIIEFNNTATFKGNKANNPQGGAIYNSGEDAKITIAEAIFGGDGADEGNEATSGGAIYNDAEAKIILNNSTFIGNEATNGSGGAIYNTNASKITLDNNIFIGNKATNGNGGAIDNSANMDFTGTTIFANNTATNGGGAISNSGYMTFDGTTIFDNNNANGVLNDIHNNATLTFKGTTTFHGGITSDTTYGSTTLTGTIYIKDGYAGETNMQQNDLTFGASGATTLDMRNNAINTLALGTSNLDLWSDVNLYLDADLSQGGLLGEIDKITSTGTVTDTHGGHKINISGIKVLADAPDKNPVTTNAVTENDDLLAITQYTGASSVVGYSPVNKYDVKYNGSDGKFTFTKTNENNPAVLTSSVASLGTYVTALNSYDQGLRFSDNIMNMPKFERMALKNRNVYALNDTENVKYNEDDNKGVWFNPYASFENVRLNNGPKVSLVSYGSYFGGDSEFLSLGKGWDVVYSGYVGYNGSHATYNGVSVNQNGGTLGGTATFMKGNYFVGTTINAGASHGHGQTMYGSDFFTTMNAGIAAKTGYNFEFAQGKFIIQPSMLMSYTFVNTFDYTNAAGVNISSQPLHAINLAPALKFIANTKNGWQPYVNLRMVWNILDKTNVTANNLGTSTKLPEMSIDPYFQYGLGIQKRWGERCTGFAEAMLNAGGRNGIALQFGFKYKLGKERV